MHTHVHIHTRTHTYTHTQIHTHRQDMGVIKAIRELRTGEVETASWLKAGVGESETVRLGASWLSGEAGL